MKRILFFLLAGFTLTTMAQRPPPRPDVATALMEKRLQMLILPQVAFQNATLDSALDALRQHAIKASGGKLQPSFVVDPNVNAATPVTLNLSNIPFIEALRYVCIQAKAQFKVEKYAIIVSPKSAD